MDKYFVDRMQYNDSKDRIIIYPDNVYSEYVPFYSILHDSYYFIDLFAFCTKNGIAPKSEEFKAKNSNNFILDFLALGLDRLMTIEGYKELLKTDEYYDTIVDALKKYLSTNPNLEIALNKDIPKFADTQIAIISGLTQHQIVEYSGGYIAPLFLSSKENTIQFTPVLKRKDAIKAKLGLISTGTWDLSLFEFWISKSFLNSELTRVNSWLKELIEETKITVKIVDNFKEIYSPLYKGFKTISERKKYLSDFEEEIKTNIKLEVQRVFGINEVAQKKALAKIKSDGLFLKDDSIPKEELPVDPPYTQEEMDAMETERSMEIMGDTSTYEESNGSVF